MIGYRVEEPQRRIAFKCLQTHTRKIESDFHAESFNERTSKLNVIRSSGRSQFATEPAAEKHL